jgi:uncharacterized damage-inducible protein DinB
MTGTLADRFRRWFEYERDAHGKALTSLEGLPEAARGTPEYAKASGLLAHVVLARWLWLVRLGAAPADAAPKRDEDFFPGAVAPDELRARLDAMESAWSSYLARLDDPELARIVTYKSLDGPGFTNTVEEALTQLFGHSWYHRGQIASFVRAAGGDPAVTDFIFWARRSVAGEP